MNDEATRHDTPPADPPVEASATPGTAGPAPSEAQKVRETLRALASEVISRERVQDFLITAREERVHAHLRELRKKPDLSLLITGITTMEIVSARAELLALVDDVARKFAPLPLEDEDEVETEISLAE